MHSLYSSQGLLYAQSIWFPGSALYTAHIVPRACSIHNLYTSQDLHYAQPMYFPGPVLYIPRVCSIFFKGLQDDLTAYCECIRVNGSEKAHTGKLHSGICRQHGDA